MIPDTRMSEYLRNAFDRYSNAPDNAAYFQLRLCFNQNNTIEIPLSHWGWKSLYKPYINNTPQDTQYYQSYFNSDYRLRIDVFKLESSAATDHSLNIRWYMYNYSSESRYKEEQLDPFGFCTILKYGGNIHAMAYYLNDRRIKIDKRLLDYDFPPAPLKPEKLYDTEPQQQIPVPTHPTQTLAAALKEEVTVTHKTETNTTGRINQHSDARYADVTECQQDYNSGLSIGYYWDMYSMNNTSYMVQFPKKEHIITIAPTGSGKNTAVQVPAILEYEESMLIIDPKGECAAITAKARKAKGHVFIVNPFNVLAPHFEDIGFKDFHGFNPLAAFHDFSDPNFVADISALSEALVMRPEGTADSYWADSARDLISCLIMYVCIEYPKERHLPKVRKLLSLSGEEFDLVIGDISEHAFTPMSNKASRFLTTTGNNSNASVISTALTATAFIDDPQLSDNLQQEDFKFSDMQNKVVTIYLILPAKFLLAYSSWFRLLITSCLDQLMLVDEKPKVSTLIMLDEFPLLGQLSAIEKAVGLSRGYGIQLWMFIQDIHQLNALYGKRAESFLSNTGMQQYFTPNDIETAERISKRIGETTVAQTKQTIDVGQMSGATLKELEYSNKSFPLLYPIEVIGLDQELQIVFFSGHQNSVVMSKNHYYKSSEYTSVTTRNPYYETKSPLQSGLLIMSNSHDSKKGIE